VCWPSQFGIPSGLAAVEVAAWGGGVCWADAQGQVGCTSGTAGTPDSFVCATPDPCVPNPCTGAPAGGCYNAGLGACTNDNGSAVCNYVSLRKAEGTACDDGAAATWDDVCTAGTCGGIDALPSRTAGSYVASVPDDGTPDNQPEILKLTMIPEASAPDRSALPPDTTFPMDLVGLTVVGLPAGGSVTVTFAAPAPLQKTHRLYKHTGAGWQDVTDHANVTFLPGMSSFAITLTDGGFGDTDGAANGRIEDPLGVVNDPAAIPTLGEWAVIVSLLLLAGLAIARLRRPSPFHS
jgi:hypothetical protein